MAQVEPMDIDAIESDFDNKENSFQCNNVLSRTPCTEKGYEELDVSELNMKLRYSVTPASSPMSKSLTGPFLDNRTYNNEEHLNNGIGAENGNLTRSLNSTFAKTESISKSKVLPLQTLSTEPFIESNRNSSMCRLLDQTDNNVVISVDNANDIDENLSLPSPCSSVPDTPEATTPTKEIPKPEGSPIMRGLKSVLSIFRQSQSPILPADDKAVKQEILSPVSELNKSEATAVQASTPVAENKQKDANSSKKSSPLKESMTFNDDLERELLWKDETTIIFKEEKIPIHKLFFQNPVPTIVPKTLNTTVEHMDISCDESITNQSNTNVGSSDQFVKNEHVLTGESDNEFLDCETTFTKDESYVNDKNKAEQENEIPVMQNITVDIARSAENPIEMNLDCKNVLKYNDIPGDIPICENEAHVSNTVVYSEMDNKDNTNIDATVNLLKSESKMSVTQDMDLKNKSHITEELQLADQNTTLAMDNEVIKHNYEINMSEGPTESAYNLKGEEIKESDQQLYCCSDKLPEYGAKSLENVNDDRNKSSDSSCILETQKNNETVADMAVTVDCSNSINKNIETQSTGLIGDEPNTDKLNMNNELVFLQNLEEESNTDLLLTNEDINIAQNNNGNPNKNDLTSIASNSENVEDIMDSKINKCKAIKNDNEDYSSILKDGHIAVDIKTSCPANSTIFKNDLDFNYELNTHMLGNEPANCENNIVSSFKNSDDSVTSPIIQLETLNSTINIDLKTDFIEINRTSSTNLSDMEGVVEIKKESSQKKSQKNLELTGDNNSLTSNVVNNDVSFVGENVSHNGCEIHELQVGNITISKLPAEIPLPDEDDLKQQIFDTNGMCNNDFNKQGITTSDVIDKISALQVKTEDNSFDIKYNQSIIAANNIEEYDGASVLSSAIESNSKIMDSEASLHREVNFIQNDNTQSIHVQEIDVQILDLKSENLAQDKVNINLNTDENNILHKENFSNNLPENNCNKTNDEESSKAGVCEHVVNKTFENNLHDNTELISSIAEKAIVITDQYCDVTRQSKPDSTNQEVIGDKRADGIDEELITSANNSPYVSVTDLDKVVETIPNDAKGEIDNIPLNTNTTFTASPPSSPKIVSKGYNFNFDEIDDPFATKTKIRMSPTPDTPNKSLQSVNEEIKVIQEMPKKVNRRKSQPERKRPVHKKNANSTFSVKSTTEESKSDKQIISAENISTNNMLDSVSIPHGKDGKDNISDGKPENSVTTEAQQEKKFLEINDGSKSVTSNSEDVSSLVPTEEINSNDVKIKNIDQTLVLSTQQEQQSTSSSGQYFSLGTSSAESSSLMNRSKNVFNLPEIDDLNFNPFATKSKMRMSPPPDKKTMNSMETVNDTANSLPQQPPDNDSTLNRDIGYTFDKKIENDSLSNISNTTLSSKNTNDVDTTVREIHTEDEDTVEGPFLEFDDLKDNQKVSEMDTDADMMNFEEIPQQERDENLENGELFIDADAFEFLLNQNKSTTVLDSGKESLFLKFDPLFAKRVSSDGILAALSKVQKRQSTPKKVAPLKQQDFVPVEKSAAGPSNVGNCGPMEDFNDDSSSNVTKPMMVVNPAFSSVITQKKPVTPKLNRRSLTFTSPAMAVIDRLLSLSGNSSHLDQNSSIPQIGRELSETDLAITQLRELLAEKEINVHTLRSESKELKDRLAALEVQVKSLETESATRLAKINELNERLLEKTKINKSMAIVVEEYERTIASLIAETEQDKKRNAEERMRLIKERDEQTAHLTSMEVSFSDLHSKYEKSKQIILSCKSNEDIYKKSIKEFQENFTKMQNNYELLKQHATSKLNHANQELEKMNRAHEAEVLKLNAMIKRKELHITSLEETLAQKTKANEELTAICDELINKVG